MSRKSGTKRPRHDVDAYQLIPIVEARPVLWDCQSRGFRSKHVKDDNWREVARECNANLTTVRKKWKNLKDQFRKELKKDFSDWHLFTALAFLTSQFPQKDQEDDDNEADGSDDEEQPRKNKYKKENNAKVTIDPDRLIDLVQVREAIWDKDDRRHHNSFKLDECWGEVADELGCSRVQARNKWKGLRDTLRRELRKTHSEWIYFQKLSFLIPQFTQLSYFPDEDEEEEQDNAVNDESMTAFYEESHRASEDESFLDIRDTKPIMSEINEAEGSSSQKKRSSPVPMMANVTNDEDVGFFNSLMPHIKKLDSEKKMALRIKIQELVYNAVYNTQLF